MKSPSRNSWTRVREAVESFMSNRKWRFSRRSKNELEGVHPDLVAIVHRALELSPVDFMVFDGIRTTADQEELILRKATRTRKSKHLKQADGYGHAVDLVPVIAGKPRWNWPALYKIASAMALAAEEEGVDLRWGGNWRRLEIGSAAVQKNRVDEYVAAKVAKGLTAFNDGVHFEIVT